MAVSNSRSWSLWAQIVSVVLALAVICGLIIGELVRQFEHSELQEDMTDKAAELSAIISQILLTGPVAENPDQVTNALSEVFQDVTELRSVELVNGDGGLLYRWRAEGEQDTQTLFYSERSLMLENGGTGKLQTGWNFQSQEQSFHAHLVTIRVFLILGIVVLAVVFILVIRRFVVVPVERLHGALEGVMQGEDARTIHLPRFTSREFLDLREAAIRVTGLIHDQAADRRKLRESEERFRNLIEGSIQGILIHRDYEPLFINQAFADIFGYDDPQDLLDLNSIDVLFASGEIARVKSLEENTSFDEETPISYEFQGKTRSGDLIWLDNRIRIVTWQGQKAVQSTIVDVTERKTSEEELRKARSQLVEAIEALPDGFVLYDEKDRLVICNQRYRDIYSLSADVIQPGNTFEYIVKTGAQRGQYPEAIGREEEWLAERLKEHNRPSGVVEQQLESGQWLRILERKTDSGGTVGFRIDITELKEREQELWESTERIRATVHTALDCIVVMDQEGKVVEFNPSAEATFGFERDEVIGREMAELIIPERYGDAHRAGLQKYLETGEGPVLGQHIEIEARRKDGTELPISLSISVSHEADGPIFVGYMRDTTERRAAEEALKIARDKAEIANNAKSEFLAMMSHEIRTPLNGVLGFLGLLLDTRLNEEQLEYVRSGRRSAESLLDVINDILDFSKMEAGRLDFETVVFSPTDIARDVIDVVKARAEENNTVVALSSSADEKIFLKGDPSRIRQVLLNLVSNAVKFTENGRVDVEVAVKTASADKARLKASVRDTGIGIDKTHHEELFSEFLTLTPAYSQKFQGTGLGLAISRRLIDHMDGKIDFSSELGKGSEFWFEIDLPVAKEEEVDDAVSTNMAEEETQDSLSHIPKNVRVLLAEDNPANQVVARTMLEKADIQVDIVANGLEAVAAMKSRPYDLVLMDIGMPEMDGMEATAEIRKLPGKRSETPIIAMTAHVMQGDRESILKGGMDDYLSKPVRKAKLLRRIVKWLKKPSDIQQAEQIPTSVVAAKETEQKDVPFLQETVLEDLASDTDLSLLPDLIETYLTSLNERVATLKTAVDGPDLEVIELESHSLKSSSASFGALRMRNVVAEIEKAAASGDAGLAVDLISDIGKVHEITVSALETYSAKLKDAQ